MIIDVRSIDITHELANTKPGEPPTAIVARYIGENHAVKPSAGVENVDGAHWSILHDVLPKDTELVRWGEDKGGTHVSVPMYEYLMTDPEPGTLARFGVQFGLLLSRLAEPKLPLERILVLLSNPFSRPDGAVGFALYVGAALKSQK